MALKVKVWALVAGLAEAVWAAELPTPAPARVSAGINQVRSVTLPAVTWKTEYGSGNV